MAEQKIGFLAGSFDVFHPGYIRMFEDSKSVCDFLVVGLHEDPSLERPEKLSPVLSVADRVEMLLALRHVDRVLVYKTEADLVALLRTINPDVRILGSDYQGRGYTGDRLSIPIHYHLRDHQWSTTEFKKEIAKSLIDRL